MARVKRLRYGGRYYKYAETCGGAKLAHKEAQRLKQEEGFLTRVVHVKKTKLFKMGAWRIYKAKKLGRHK